MADTALDRLPNAGELLAYRSLLRAHARVTRCLEGDLIVEQRLTLAAYEVLASLDERADDGLRMTELADTVLLSRSGVTRLVDRLERLGFVDRVRASTDGRGVRAQITERGRQRLRRALPTYLNGVARYFLSALGGDGLEALAHSCQSLAGGGVPTPPGQRAQV